MNRKLVGNQAASYVLGGLLLTMLVTFVACDLNAVRREAFLQNEGKCSTVTVSACPGHATILRGVPGVLIASVE
jgi:hypothetical protein